MKDAKVLRISVTDRCDLRCVYCMPESGLTLVRPSDLLTYEEIETVARAAMTAGVRRFRVTGGEPLVRRGIEALVEKLARLDPDDLALTTNGLHLGEKAAALKAAGLRRVTVSLDTLRRDRFETIARRTGFDLILEGIDAAQRAGLSPLKINTVVIRGVNDDEVAEFVRFGNDGGSRSASSSSCRRAGSARNAKSSGPGGRRSSSRARRSAGRSSRPSAPWRPLGARTVWPRFTT